MKYILYCLEAKGNVKPKLFIPSEYSYKFWRPSILEITPPGAPLIPYAFWWLFHYLRLFTVPEYGMLIVYSNKKLIHCSVALPSCFRTPFIPKNDIQVSNTWTHPGYRNKGIATFACQQIIFLNNKPGRKFWYVSAEDNISSIKVAERCGFAKMAEGIRTKVLGSYLLGVYNFFNTSEKNM